MTIRRPDQPEPAPVNGLASFASTAVALTAAPEDGPHLLYRAARRLCDAGGRNVLLGQAAGELTAHLEPGLHARMFFSTEMRGEQAKTSLLHLNLRLFTTTGTPPTASLGRWADVWHRQPLTAQETQRVAGELPLMSATVQRLRDGKPLAGFALMVTGHFLTDLVHLVGCLAELGAPLEAMTVLRKDYAYQWRHRVHGHLADLGVSVCDATDPEAVARHTALARRQGLRCLALDDGGYVVPALLDQARSGRGPDSAAGLWAGVVEQTMSGIYNLKATNTTCRSRCSPSPSPD
ncbi:hypothetical protein OG206_31730 [Streptomyces sp. NBC_01341]|uniref:hypothetical protein n=1 Tax=Streptomyces sp. NBC_01341 TaxID=2903831 RepID=UPI002E0D7320|nr:hypothetical protein OG206_31730 [Streptomyces sp. NBC_01341]